jgi:hypothetical protein
MCNGHAGRTLAFALAALFTAAPGRALGAQTQAEYRARVQALVPIWKAVTAEGRREDSLRKLALPRDTVQAGVLTIRADSNLQQLARDAGLRATSALVARFGDRAADVRTHVLTLSNSTMNVGDRTTAAVGEVDSLGRATLTSDVIAAADAVGESFALRGSQLLTDRLGRNFGRWLSNAIPVDSATRDEWVGVRIDLVTSPFAAARECYTGAIRSCELSLGVAGEQDPARLWYTATKRRELVERDGYELRRGHEDSFDQCVVHGNDAACLELAQLIPLEGVAPPLSADARQNLVRLAMSMGGPQAYARMLGAANTRSAQLAAASGVSIDSLVSRWRAQVVMTEADHTTMTPGVALMSLVWVTTCGGLALGSSRWR